MGPEHCWQMQADLPWLLQECREPLHHCTTAPWLQHLPGWQRWYLPCGAGLVRGLGVLFSTILMVLTILAHIKTA